MKGWPSFSWSLSAMRARRCRHCHLPDMARSGEPAAPADSRRSAACRRCHGMCRYSDACGPKNFIASFPKSGSLAPLLVCAPAPSSGRLVYFRAAMLCAALPLSTKLWCFCSHLDVDVAYDERSATGARRGRCRSGSDPPAWPCCGRSRSAGKRGAPGRDSAGDIRCPPDGTSHRGCADGGRDCRAQRPDRKLRVGPQVPELALARPSHSPLMVAAEPHLAGVSAQLRCPVPDCWYRLDSLCVARRIGRILIQVLSIEVGARRPLGVAARGWRYWPPCLLRGAQDRARQRNQIQSLSDRHANGARPDPAGAPPWLQFA